MAFFLCRSILSFVAAIANATTEKKGKYLLGRKNRGIKTNRPLSPFHELVKSILQYLGNSETRHGLLSNSDKNV